MTDDSEMAMCIMYGLTDKECAQIPEEVAKVLNLDGITYYFGKWQWNAYDIDLTTSKALLAVEDRNKKIHNYTVPVFRNVKTLNHFSQSNGGLMRITPLIVWGRNLSNQELYQAIKLETHLTHLREEVIESAYLYGFALRYLYKNSGKAMEAYEMTREECFRRVRSNEAKARIDSWFNEVDAGLLPTTEVNIDWAKIGFNYAFFFLK